MIVHPMHRFRSPVPTAVLMLALAFGPGHADAADRPVRVAADPGGSLVLCTPARLPVQALAGRHGLVHRIGDGRFFAPTRQAIFFSRPGDRCAWRAGAPIKG